MATLFIIAKNWKQLKCPLIHKWISKMWCFSVTEYYLPIKKNKPLTRMTIWMNHKDILSISSQSQRLYTL